MTINTRFFSIRCRSGLFAVRLGSYEHGLQAKVARLGSYCRLNWGIASWQIG